MHCLYTAETPAEVLLARMWWQFTGSFICWRLHSNASLWTFTRQSCWRT